MAEKMNTGMEKVFFNYIMNAPKHFSTVEAEWFRTADIKIIYSTIKSEYLLTKKIPATEQIIAMVKLNDPNNLIAPNIIKLVLKDSEENFEKEWLDSKFNAWKLEKQTRNRLNQALDFLRDVEEVNYDNVKDVTTKIKNLFSDIKLNEDSEEELCVDFDDIEAHQLTAKTKHVSTGWGTLDQLLEGGWTPQTLCVIMAETNGGKCLIFSTLAKVHDTTTDEICDIEIGKLFEIS